MVTASVWRNGLTGLVLVLLMTGTVLLMEHEVGRSTRARMTAAGEQVAGLLDGAARAAAQAAVLTGEDCPSRTRARLTAIVAQNPAVRGIRLLREGRTVCAVFPQGEAAPLPEGWQMRSGWSLAFSARDVAHPGMPVLLLGDGGQARGVVVSISSAPLLLVLRGGPDRPALVLLAGGQALDQTGWLQADAPASGRVYQDRRWPFRLHPDPLRSFSWWSFLSDCWFWLLLCLAVTFLAVRLCHWRPVMAGRGVHRLRQAIQSGDICPWYQPVVCSVSGAVSGCEVLARWPTAGGRMVMPDEFIPLAEKSGLTLPLTLALMRRVEADLVPAQSWLPECFHLAINVTPGDMLSPAFETACRQLAGALSARRVQLVLEITERAPVQGSAALQRAMVSLRRLGVKVALDDFGTGRAGLTGLEHLPVDYLKLDRSFTVRADRERLAGEGCPVAEVVTGMAERLNLEVVAEGVETPRQRDWLRAHGVRWLQGWLFSPPLPAVEFIRYLSQHQEPCLAADPPFPRTGGACE